MSKEYAPLPFSYLTGGLAPEKKPTGFKKTGSESESGGVDPDGGVPYRLYSGQTLDRRESQEMRNQRSLTLDVDDLLPPLDVADPYLLSTGALTADRPSDQRNSYSEDPRYRDSVPSETHAGNVFFRPSDSGTELSNGPQSKAAAGYVNHGLDSMPNEEEPAPTGVKKLPRYIVADHGEYEGYSASNGGAPTGRPQVDKTNDSSANPIWDKYYATGGLVTADGKLDFDKARSPVSPSIRPITKTDDHNNLLRSSSVSTRSDKCCSCCATKTGAVLCAVFITAAIFLAIGIVCGWYLLPLLINDDESATATTTTTMITMSSTAEAVAQTTAESSTTTDLVATMTAETTT